MTLLFRSLHWFGLFTFSASVVVSVQLNSLFIYSFCWGWGRIKSIFQAGDRKNPFVLLRMIFYKFGMLFHQYLFWLYSYLRSEATTLLHKTPPNS